MKTVLALGFVACFVCAMAVDCPEEDENSHATYYPHEIYCGEFYECRNGEALILECPSGLYWDARLNVCNWDVDCGDLLTSTVPPPTTTQPPTTPQPPTTTLPSTATEEDLELEEEEYNE